MNAVKKERWWWCAINGSSCAACNFPASANIQVMPRPQFMVGFRTRQEQLSHQKLVLTCPPEQFENIGRQLSVERALGNVMLIKIPNPEPQTDGPTLWMDDPNATEASP